MEVYFEKDYLAELYQTGKTSDKKHRYQPDIVRRYQRVIALMIDAEDINALKRFNGLNYEKLIGTKEGVSSVRVNDNYRIEFEEHILDGQSIATICNIIELSNHYS